MRTRDAVPVAGTTAHDNFDQSPTILPRRLTGARCRCSACGQQFNSTTAFDAHRVGDYLPQRRRCLTPEHMIARGMHLNPGGYWITETRTERVLRRGRAAGSGDRLEVNAKGRAAFSKPP
jgi:hypothetical protein